MAETLYHEAPAQDASALPVMLPGKLVGRDELLTGIYRHLKQNRPVLLYGKPGVGKTALAATLASAYTQEPGGVLWLHMDEMDTLASLIVRIGRAYGDFEIANSETPAGMVGAAATLLSQNKPLVVLDGRPDVDVAAEFIARVAADLPMMVTQQAAVEGNWELMAVPALDADAAAVLFREKSGLDSPVVGEIVDVLGGLPFALVMSAGAARVNKLDAASVLSTLQGADADTPAERALRLGFGHLKQALQGILLMLGATFSGSASLGLLAQLSGAPVDTVQKVMTILSAAGFVQRDQRYGEPYYYLHSLAHDYAQTFLARAGRLEPLRDKARDTLIAYAQRHTGNNAEDHNALAVEMENFLAAAQWGTSRGEGDVASQIVVALTQADSFIKGRGYLYELLQLQAAGSSGASAFPANPDVGGVSGAPEDTDMERGVVEAEDDEAADVFEAVEVGGRPEDVAPESELDNSNPEALRGAINRARSSGDNERVQELQTRLGDLLRSQGKQTEALAVYNDLLATYEDTDDEVNMLAVLQKMAGVMVAQESSQAAVLHAARGVKLAEKLDDTPAKARMMVFSGDARQQLGESTDAIVAYSQAIDLADAAGEPALKADAMMKLGFAQLDDDETGTAIETWNEALALCRELDKRDCEGRILGGLGTAHGELERWAEAINYHTSALYIAREVGDRAEIALQLSNLGFAAKQAGRKGEAVLRYRQALHLAYQADERDNIVTAIVDLVRLLVNSDAHLKLAQMLIEDAAERDGGDRDVSMLQERVNNELMMAEAQGTSFKPVEGSAQDYARHAYMLLDE